MYLLVSNSIYGNKISRNISDSTLCHAWKTQTHKVKYNFLLRVFVHYAKPQTLICANKFSNWIDQKEFKSNINAQVLGDSGDFQTSRYQDIVKATVSGVFEDLKFKISEGQKQN